MKNKILSLICVVALVGCAHVTPTQEQYAASYKVCLEQQGITDLENNGMQIWKILDAGGSLSTTIVQKVENFLISVGGTAVQLLTGCAVSSWFNLNPVTGNPTPAQGAARILLLRHARPTLPRLHP